VTATDHNLAAGTRFTPSCRDQVALNEWHPISAIDEIDPVTVEETILLDDTIRYTLNDSGEPEVWAASVGRSGGSLPTRVKFGYLWTSLGTPTHELFDIEECDESDRRTLNGGSIMVAVSAPRAVENFLDMGHFPYVHTGILGVEPRTEVEEYDIETTEDQVLATKCRFYQPMASAAATGGQMTDYIYRVPHPYCVMLYKSVPTDPSRMDVIALFNQPMGQERIRAHNFLCMVDDVNTITGLKRFQQLIFGQDKTILESQWPKKLPLDPRAEVPIRADKSAIAYRRWLSAKGLTYAVLPSGI